MKFAQPTSEVPVAAFVPFMEKESDAADAESAELKIQPANNPRIRRGFQIFNCWRVVFLIITLLPSGEAKSSYYYNTLKRAHSSLLTLLGS